VKKQLPSASWKHGMSFDLIVFDSRTGPRNARDGKEFMVWFNAQAESEESQYNDVQFTTPELRNWYREMITLYPPLNGPEEPEDIDNPKLTDYSIGKFAICGAFAWSRAEDAFATAFRLAQKHAVGFLNISSDEARPWFPT
jgi:hypothetical protein